MNNVKLPVWVNNAEAWIKLKPGQTLSWEKCEPTDEGWNYYAESWELSADGQELRHQYVSDGADCDGRLRSGGEYIAAASRHNWRPNPYKIEWTPAGYVSPLYPDWISRDEWQRDQFAEAMGY